MPRYTLAIAVLVVPVATAAQARPKQSPVVVDNDVTIVDDADDEQPTADVEPPVEAAPAHPMTPRRAVTGVYFRAGLIHQESNATATDVKLPIPLPPGTSAGVELIDSQFPLAAIIGYALPVLDHRLALETVLGVPPTVEFRATGALATESLAPTVSGMPSGIPALGAELGKATFATPILTAVYRLPDVGRVTVLVGLGGMLLYAYDEKVTNPVLVAAGAPKLSIAPAAGFVLQGGAEVRMWGPIAARLDVKYVPGVTVESRVDDISVIPTALPQLGTLDLGSATVRARIAPIIVQAGVGTSF
jgi:outer membrane protein W